MRRSEPRDRRRAIAVTLTAVVLATPSWASAYCRTASCPDPVKGRGTGSICTPAQPTDCRDGAPLFWPTPCVSYSLQEDASRQIPLDVAESIFDKAFASWMGVDCGDGQNPRVVLSATEPVACRAHEYNQNNRNANIIVFRDEGWPYSDSGRTLALTTTTYNLDTGEIYDADMELNTIAVQFSHGDGNVTFDLLSVATHEAGHFLGLSHSADMDATMFADYREHSISLRDLNDDDRTAICTVYPPGEPIKACDFTPRHGFSSLCAADQPEEEQESTAQCTAVAPRSAPGGLRLAALALIAVAARARRARGPRGPS